MALARSRAWRLAYPPVRGRPSRAVAWQWPSSHYTGVVPSLRDNAPTRIVRGARGRAGQASGEQAARPTTGDRGGSPSLHTKCIPPRRAPPRPAPRFQSGCRGGAGAGLPSFVIGRGAAGARCLRAWWQRGVADSRAMARQAAGNFDECHGPRRGRSPSGLGGVRFGRPRSGPCCIFYSAVALAALPCSARSGPTSGPAPRRATPQVANPRVCWPNSPPGTRAAPRRAPPSPAALRGAVTREGARVTTPFPGLLRTHGPTAPRTRASDFPPSSCWSGRGLGGSTPPRVASRRRVDSSR